MGLAVRVVARVMVAGAVVIVAVVATAVVVVVARVGAVRVSPAPREEPSGDAGGERRPVMGN
ncbi:hypothetical protein WMF37_26500 [Sorangium sp. So ce291]|uniref:hypothetical protein n=1 Tax=Sorangium sp. So ce291 TaxID=3133294 RepID=UPI003F5E6E60